MPDGLFCSTIIPTIGRDSLARAVGSVLEQEMTAGAFEVIVVNDSGRPLPPADWQQSERVTILSTNRRERSVARNSGAAVARGRYLHFLDDDDCLLPGALEQFWELAGRSQAAWLYGGYRLVDRQGKLLEECYPDEGGNCLVRFLAGEWLPLQASLIQSEAFFAAGGFASLESLLGGNEDVDLARQISLHHGVEGVAHLVAAIHMGLDGSTTNFTNLHAQSLQSRERALSAPGARARLRDSARARGNGAAYWHGRAVWIYLASVAWNVRQRRPLTAASRLTQGAVTFAQAGGHILRRGFWRGAARPHLARGWLSTRL